jgi:hypothetical protein
MVIGTDEKKMEERWIHLILFWSFELDQNLAVLFGLDLEGVILYYLVEDFKNIM